MDYIVIAIVNTNTTTRLVLDLESDDNAQSLAGYFQQLSGARRVLVYRGCDPQNRRAAAFIAEFSPPEDADALVCINDADALTPR